VVHTEGKDEVEVYHAIGKVLKGTGEYANLVKELDIRSGFFYIRREREDYILTIHTQAFFSKKRGRPERIYVVCRVKARSPEEAIDRLLKSIEGLEGEETEWGKVEKVKHPEEIEELLLLNAIRRVKDMDATKAKKYLPAINKAVEEEEKAATFEANAEEALTLALNVVKTIDRVGVVLHFKNFSHYDVLRKYVGIFITGKPLSPVGEFYKFFRRYTKAISAISVAEKKLKDASNIKIIGILQVDLWLSKAKRAFERGEYESAYTLAERVIAEIERIEEAYNKIENAKSTISALEESSIGSIKLRLSRAKEICDEAQNKFKNGDYETAMLLAIKALERTRALRYVLPAYLTFIYSFIVISPFRFIHSITIAPIKSHMQKRREEKARAERLKAEIIKELEELIAELERRGERGG